MDDEGVVRIGDVTVPLSELDFTFSGSSGPGGQHVNRTATKVTLRFDVAGSPSLSEAQRARLLEKLAPRIDAAGVLQVQAQDTRSQRRNRDLAIRRFAQLVAAALRKRRPRIPTKPSSAAIQRRIDAKRRRSRKKADRRPPAWSGD